MTAVTASGRLCGNARGTLTVGRSRGLTHAGLWRHDDPMAGQLRPPGDVEIIPEEPKGGVKAPKDMEDIAPDEHS
jgi:hypothetical protein